MSGDIAIVGHRGWRSRFPDNTLSGIIAAARICDAIEVDVRRSSDGKLVLAHDPDLGPFQVAVTPWSVLTEVELGSGHRPCLLDEALATVPETPLMIEIKNQPGSPGFEPDHRLGLEAAARARPRDTVTSFNWATVDAVSAVFPDLKTGLIVGILGNIEEAVSHASTLGHEYVVPNVRLFETREPDQSVSSDATLYVWASEEADFLPYTQDELVSRKVSGIITDDPVGTRDRLEGGQ